MVDKVFASPRFAGNATLKEVLNGRALLRRGSQGEPVKRVQRALIDLGETMSAGTDGDFGIQTEAAVRHYQSARSPELTADGIVGPKTMGRIDADIVVFDTPALPPPPPPPPKVLKTLRFWINAFIPDTSLTPDVYPAPGASAGQTMIKVPFPNTSFQRCFLGDNRPYSMSETASARIHAMVEFVNLDLPTLRIGSQSIFCGLSIEIDPTSGVVIGTATAPATRCKYDNLRSNQTVEEDGNIVTDSPSPNFVQLDFVAAANLPLLLGSPDIDMNGRLQIDRDAKTFIFKGMMDAFPAFEARVSFNGGPAINVLEMRPIEPFQLIGDANRPISSFVPIIL